MEVEKREIIYLSLQRHHQNDFCIKMGSDESHFNVSLIVRVKVTRQCPQTTTFKQKGEPKRSRTEVPLLTSLTPNRQAKPAHTRLTYDSSRITQKRQGKLRVCFDHNYKARLEMLC